MPRRCAAARPRSELLRIAWENHSSHGTHGLDFAAPDPRLRRARHQPLRPVRCNHKPLCPSHVKRCIQEAENSLSSGRHVALRGRACYLLSRGRRRCRRPPLSGALVWGGVSSYRRHCAPFICRCIRPNRSRCWHPARSVGPSCTGSGSPKNLPNSEFGRAQEFQPRTDAIKRSARTRSVQCCRYHRMCQLDGGGSNSRVARATAAHNSLVSCLLQASEFYYIGS